MMRVFIDANVFFAAIYNPDGGSGFVLNLYQKVINTSEFLRRFKK